MLGGNGNSSPWSAYGFAVMRLTRQGEPDPTFGPGGGLFTPMDLGGVSGLAVQPDGKVVAAGTTGWDLGLARYLARLGPGVPPDQGAVTTPLGGDPGGSSRDMAPEPVTNSRPVAGAERVGAPIALASLGRPPTLQRLARRGWPVRVRVARPGLVSLRLMLRRGGQAESAVLARGSRRVHPGSSRVLLRAGRFARTRLAGPNPRRLNAILRARFVEDGGAPAEASRRVTLRPR